MTSCAGDAAFSRNDSVFPSPLLCSVSGEAGYYHWRELPQVSFLSRQMFCRDKQLFVSQMCCRDKHVFVATKHVICRNKSMLVATKRLWHQTRVCRDKHNFVATNIILSRQKLCRGNHTFVATKDVIRVAVPAKDS